MPVHCPRQGGFAEIQGKQRGKQLLLPAGHRPEACLHPLQPGRKHIAHRRFDGGQGRFDVGAVTLIAHHRHKGLVGRQNRTLGQMRNPGHIGIPFQGSKGQLTADADTLYIREGSSSRRFPRNEEYVFTPESELGLPSLARMQKMIAEAEAGKYTLTMETMLDSPCIRAIFTDTASGVREIFDILPDYGIIVTASSCLPGEQSPYYMMQTNSILTDISEFDEAIFEIPTS